MRQGYVFEVNKKVHFNEQRYPVLHFPHFRRFIEKERLFKNVKNGINKYSIIGLWFLNSCGIILPESGR